MKATEGGVAKTKNSIKATSTKAKPTKKARKGRTATKKQPVRKKTLTSAATKKKSGDAKKTTATKRKRIVDSNTETTTKRNRRSNRTRNNIFNYDELSHDGSSIPSDDEMIPCNQQKATTRKNSRRPKDSSIAKSRKGDKSNEVGNGNDYDETDEESHWDIYDHQKAEKDSEEEWNERYRRLQEFHSTYGHSGVAIGWSAEPGFAAWVSRQRQLFREIHSGYRIASAQEENRWKRLQILNFPLNYDAWLWQRNYNKLCEVLNGRNYNEITTCLPPPLSEWVHLQRSLMNNTNAAIRGRLDPERRRRLEELGVIVGEGSSDGISSRS